MHPDKTYITLQKLDKKLTKFVKALRKSFNKKRQILPFGVNKITFRVDISLLHSEYCQLSYYDGETRKAVIKELFGKANRVYFNYFNSDDVPDYFKIFINTKSKFDVCTVSITTNSGVREMRFEVACNYPSGQWFFCYLKQTHN